MFFHFFPSLFFTAASNPLHLLLRLSFCVVCACVCVCLEAFQSLGARKGRHREAVAVMQRWIFINHPPSFLFLPFFPSFSSLCLLSPSSLLLSPAPDSTQSQPDVQTLAVPTSLPTAYDNAAMFLPIGNLDNCGRWLLLKRGDGKQLALTHRATAAPQIVTLSQIVARNYTLPRYSDGGVDCLHF